METTETTSHPRNVLLLMADEHAPQFSGPYGHPTVRTPNLDKLARAGVTFENAYCNSPLCVPSRMSFLTGRYVHNIEVWDNAVPLRSDAVTWPHLLRSAGYDTVLSGKQHFVGPDKLHGFRTQLAEDLHGNHFHPIFNWEDGTPPASNPWPILERSGPGHTVELDVDDSVGQAAIRFIEAPERKARPWALCASFIAPHFPLIVPEEFWHLYPPDAIDMPHLPAGHLERQHPVYQRIRSMFGFVDFGEELTRRGRAAYYALITYVDHWIGRILQALETSDQASNTLVIYVSDHGEMAGEHGMWRKSNFYEFAARVPLLMRWPQVLPAGRRIAKPVSLVDVTATLVAATGTRPPTPLDGISLLALARGDSSSGPDHVFAEYLAHGVARPMAMWRQGRYKLNYSLGDTPELYDLEADPREFHDLATDPRYHSIVAELREKLLASWYPETLEQRVRRSQVERLLIRAVETGRTASEERLEWAREGSRIGPPSEANGPP
ncbi:MAG: sulfatase-like hydrolase/transferase [Chloroflexi bacterium]|nr:sulfatase-like hydrolase/transferase [Chloroflexota bacterium]